MEYLGGGSALDLVSEVTGKEKGNESIFSSDAAWPC